MGRFFELAALAFGYLITDIIVAVQVGSFIQQVGATSISGAAGGLGVKKLRDAAPGHARLVRQLVVEQLSPAQLQHLGEAAAAVVHAVDAASLTRRRQPIIGS